MAGALAVLGLGAVPVITSRRGSVFIIGATGQVSKFLRQVLGKDIGRREGKDCRLLSTLQADQKPFDCVTGPQTFICSKTSAQLTP